MKNKDKLNYPAWKHALPIALMVGGFLFMFTHFIMEHQNSYYIGGGSTAFVFVWEYIVWTKLLNRTNG